MKCLLDRYNIYQCIYMYVRDLLCLSGTFYWNLATSVKCTKFNYLSVCTSSVRDNFFVCACLFVCVHAAH